MGQINFPKACFYCATTENLEIHTITIGQTTKKSRFPRRGTEYHSSYAMMQSPVCKNCFKKIRMKGLDSLVIGAIMIIATLLIIFRILLSENIVVLLAIFWVIYLPLFFSGISFLVTGVQIIRDLRPSNFIGGELIRNTEIYQNSWIIKTIVISTDEYAKIFQEMNPDIKIIVKHSKITPIVYSIFKTIKDLFKPKNRHQ